jgi:hypothetical protein
MKGGSQATEVMPNRQNSKILGNSQYLGSQSQPNHWSQNSQGSQSQNSQSQGSQTRSLKKK